MSERTAILARRVIELENAMREISEAGSIERAAQVVARETHPARSITVYREDLEGGGDEE